MIPVILVVSIIIAAIVWMSIRSRNPSFVRSRAEKELAAGNSKAARADFTRALFLLETGKGKSADRKQLVGEICMRLGDLHQSAGERPQAVEAYRKAREAGARLPKTAVCFLAESYAAEQSRGDDALEAYLIYISSTQPRNEASGYVFAVLQSICHVSEEMKSAPRKAAAAACQRVIAVRADLEWAHYFLGLSNLIDGHTIEALSSFASALKLNENRIATVYWMCVCYLQKPDPEIDQAIAMLERLLAAPAEDAKSQKRRARACSEVGKKLVERLGGFDSTDEWRTGASRNTLDRVIRYFQIAAAAPHEDAASQFLLGRSLGRAGDTSGMLSALERAADLAPREKAYAYRLGRERFRIGDLTGSETALRQAITADSKYGDALALLGEVLVRNGDFEAAEGVLRAARNVRSDTVSLTLLLLRALFGQSKCVEVIKEVETSLLDPAATVNDEDAAFAVARSYALCGKYDSAAIWLKKLPGDARSFYYLGCAYANMELFPEARACFSTAIEGGGDYVARALIQRGHVLHAEGSIGAAEKDYIDADRLGDNTPEASYALGLLLLEKGELESAVPWLKRSLSLDARYSQAHFALAVAYERMGKADAALEHYLLIASGSEQRNMAVLRAAVLQCRLGKFAEALNSLKENTGAVVGPTVLFYRGIALAQCGRIDEAIADWTILRDQYPQNDRLALNLARAHYLEGSQHLSSGRLLEAIAQWSEYLHLYPQDERASRDCAELYFRLAATKAGVNGADLGHTMELLRSAVEADPMNPVYSYYLALAKLRTGKPREGLEEIDRLIELQGRQSRLIHHAACCFLAMGDREGAMKLFAEARTIEPKDRYSVFSAWALGNEEVRDGRAAAAIEILSGAATELQFAT